VLVDAPQKLSHALVSAVTVRQVGGEPHPVIVDREPGLQPDPSARRVARFEPPVVGPADHRADGRAGRAGVG
jgi:hypothetical protein